MVILYYKYNNNGTSIHSSNIEDINTFYIYKKNIECINNWPFIINNINLINYGETLFKSINIINNNYQNLDEVFLLKCEIHNAGHLICNILYQLYYYLFNNLKCKIITPFYIKNNIFILKLLEYYININDIIYIDSETKYLFNNIIILSCNYTYTYFCSDIYNINNDSHNIKLYNVKPLINNNYTIDIYYFINIIKNKNITFKKIDKILLIKTKNKINKHTMNANYIYSLERSFDNEYENFFINNNFVSIDFNEYSIDEYYYLLNNCNTIILSWGCISWLNKMFITNEINNVILLGHLGYYYEYNNLKNLGDFIPKCKNLQVILNLKSNFTEEIKNILEEAIINL